MRTDNWHQQRILSLALRLIFLMPFKAINMGQKTKTIAYAVGLNQDETPHVDIFEALRMEVVRIVNSLLDLGHKV